MNAAKVNKHGTARRGITAQPGKEIPGDRTTFNGTTFEALAEDLTTGRIPLPRVTISDEMTIGLRCIVRNTGNISYHVAYEAPDGSRPYMKIGDYPETTVAKARERANTIRALSAKGIDVQAGLHERLLREIDRDGVKWKP